ncbi:MAG: hypothetical protein LBT21_02785 [Oscillospiraceae bacterium]|nr:hypothetical protein [Oscillospiraceae bacterium]
MKKLFAALIAMLLLLSSCGADKSDPAPQKTDELPAFFSELGKTLNDLKTEHPAITYTGAAAGGAGAECVGDPSENFSYFFYATQSPPTLEMMAEEYGDRLKCAGFSSTAGVVFSALTKNMPMADFLEVLGITDYDYLSEVVPGGGWLSFENEDYYFNIYNADFSEENRELTEIKSNYHVLVYSKANYGELNSQICQEYGEAHNWEFFY